MRYYLLISFLFVAILWHSCWSDCNPYRMKQGNIPDTINADTIQFYVDPMYPDSLMIGVYKDAMVGKSEEAMQKDIEATLR